MSRRNPRLLAAAALLIAIAALIVAIIAATGGGDDHTKPAGTQPSKPPADQHAADRAAIQRVAEAWRRSLNPHSTDNPCRYMTKQYRGIVYSEVQGDVDVHTCAQAIRKSLNQGDVPLYQATQGGLASITFSNSVHVEAVTSTAPGAVGAWRAAGYPPVSFVREGGEWKVAG